MKAHKFSLFTLMLAFAWLISSCGGGPSDVAADTPADFTMSAQEFDDITPADKAKYEGKVVQISGTVTKTKEAHPSEAENGPFMIKLTGAEPEGMSFAPEITCYFSEDQAAHMGKEATVKGKVKFYEIADGAFLVGCHMTTK